jgi:hypothetical protein
MQVQMIAGCDLRDNHAAAIPRRPKERPVSDAARRRFRSEGHQDFSCPPHVTRVLPQRLPVDGEVPLSIESGPSVSGELRTRVVTFDTVARLAWLYRRVRGIHFVKAIRCAATKRKDGQVE